MDGSGRKMRSVADTDLVIIRAFSTIAEAEIARGALEAADIDALVQSDSAGGMRPHLAWAGSGYKLLVREEDAVAAESVLRA